MFSVLSPTELARISRWKYKVMDLSITTQLFTPWWNWLVQFIPFNVSPNMVTLVGFLCNLYSFSLCQNYFSRFPMIVTFLTVLLTFAYYTLDALDGKHARRTKNSTPIGELFDHTCDAVSTIIMALNLCTVMQIQDTVTQTLVVTLGMLGFLQEHLHAFGTKIVTFSRLGSSGELLLAYLSVFLLQGFGGFFLTPWVPTQHTFLVLTILAYLWMGWKTWSYCHNNYATRNGLWLVFGIKLLELVASYYQIMNFPSNSWTVISHGALFVIPIVDIILCKMGQKEMSQWVPVAAMISLFDPFLNVVTCALFIVVCFYQLCDYMNCDMFTPRTTVYLSGVFDPFHPNHARFARLAAEHGNRVVVGVHNAEDVKTYKREPTLSLEQRCEMVEACRWVDEVIPNAPLYLEDETCLEFLDHHKINIVAASDEYGDPNDRYYKYPREHGFLVEITRGKGISSSAIKKAFLNWFTREELEEQIEKIDLFT